jgi:hypothetical protein
VTNVAAWSCSYWMLIFGLPSRSSIQLELRYNQSGEDAQSSMTRRLISLWKMREIQVYPPKNIDPARQLSGFQRNTSSLQILDLLPQPYFKQTVIEFDSFQSLTVCEVCMAANLAVVHWFWTTLILQGHVCKLLCLGDDVLCEIINHSVHFPIAISISSANYRTLPTR